MIADARVIDILEALQDLASGDLDVRLPISNAHDHLDAIAHAINVVGGEMGYSRKRIARAKDELKHPVTAILQIAELLRQGHIDEAGRQDLYDRIAINAMALEGLLENVLDMA